MSSRAGSRTTRAMLRHLSEDVMPSTLTRATAAGAGGRRRGAIRATSHHPEKPGFPLMPLIRQQSERTIFATNRARPGMKRASWHRAPVARLGAAARADRGRAGATPRQRHHRRRARAAQRLAARSPGPPTRPRPTRARAAPTTWSDAAADRVQARRQRRAGRAARSSPSATCTSRATIRRLASASIKVSGCVARVLCRSQVWICKRTALDASELGDFERPELARQHRRLQRRHFVRPVAVGGRGAG